jgi:hypothetical protein
MSRTRNQELVENARMQLPPAPDAKLEEKETTSDNTDK